MIDASGIQPWAAAATGQAIGSIGFVLVGLGWGVTGPASVAAANASVRRREYFESVEAKLFVLTPVVVVGLLVVWIVVPSYWAYGAGGFFSTSLIGLTGNWYFTGTGQAWLLVMLETVPRVAGTVVGIAAMLAWNLPALTCLVGTAFGGVLATLVETQYIHRHVAPEKSTKLEMRKVGPIVRSQFHAVTIGVSGAAYGSLPIVLVSQINSSSLAAFAILDKTQKQMVTASAPMFNVLQGWVPQAGRRERIRKRAGVAIVLGATVGAVAVLAFALMGRWALDVLSRSTVDVSMGAAVATGFATALYILDSIVGRAALVPLGEVRKLLTMTLAGSVVGLGLVALLSLNFGATGAMVGFSAGLGLRVVWGIAVFLRVPIAEEAVANEPTHAMRKAV